MGFAHLPKGKRSNGSFDETPYSLATRTTVASTEGKEERGRPKKRRVLKEVTS